MAEQYFIQSYRKIAITTSKIIAGDRAYEVIGNIYMPSFSKEYLNVKIGNEYYLIKIEQLERTLRLLHGEWKKHPRTKRARKADSWKLSKRFDSISIYRPINPPSR